MLTWRLVGRGLDNTQILAPDGQGGMHAINRVMTTGQPDKWWLTGPKGASTIRKTTRKPRASNGLRRANEPSRTTLPV